MYIVIMVQSFDAETPCYAFDDYEKAKAYMYWLWEDYYNTEIAQSEAPLDKTLCYHTDDYAKVTWVDGDKTEFIVTFTSEPDKEFFKGDWRRYL